MTPEALDLGHTSRFLDDMHKARQAAEDARLDEAVDKVAAAGWRFLAREWQAKAEEYRAERDALRAGLGKLRRDVARELREIVSEHDA